MSDIEPLTLDLTTLPTEVLTKFAAALSEAHHGRRHGPWRPLIDKINEIVAKRHAAEWARFIEAKDAQDRRRLHLPEVPR
jgi:hypothetical protein